MTTEILEQRLQSRVVEIEARRREEAQQAEIQKGLDAISREIWKLGPEGQLDELAAAHASKHNVSKAKAMDAVLKTSKGAALYLQFKSDHDAGEPGAVEMAGKAAAEAKLETLAEAVAAEMEIGKSAAMDSVLGTPLGAELYAKTRVAAFTSIDPPPSDDAIARKRNAEAQIEKLAEKFARDHDCTIPFATFEVLKTAEGGALYKQTKLAA